MPSEPRPPYLRCVALRDTAARGGYPSGLPAVRDLDIELAPVTVLVGDNGSGKSTIVEAIAIATGFNAEGGGRNLRFATLSTHSDLFKHLRLTWKQRPRWGWFLRAETFYGMASHITVDRGQHGVAGMFPDLHSRSHGQSFLTLIEDRFSMPGLYIMDEPESALSFQGQLKLLRFIHDGVAAGAQFVVATHSPLLMRVEGARIYELGDEGITRVDYDDLAVVALWRRFMNAPERMLEVLYADDESDD